MYNDGISLQSGAVAYGPSPETTSIWRLQRVDPDYSLPDGTYS
jgi:hypothetical protein